MVTKLLNFASYITIQSSKTQYNINTRPIFKDIPELITPQHVY